MNLRELVDTVEVPDTRVADDAWDRAHRRLRRRRTVIAAGVGAGVAGVLVAVSAITPQSGQHAPTPMTGSPDPTATTADAENHLPVTIIKPDWQDLGTAPALAPPADAPALSEDPVSHAALVMGDPEDQAAAYVLGDDGGWRRLDVPGLVPRSPNSPYPRQIVMPTELDPTGTWLAVPQPGSLVVVDLTTGGSRTYDVLGPTNHYAVWIDQTHVLVAEEQVRRSVVVDLDTGGLTRSPYPPTTRVLPDSVLAWPPGQTYSWNGRSVTTLMNNSGSLFPSAPLLKDGRGVVVNAGYSMPGTLPDYPPAALFGTIGIAAVDLSSGDPVGYVQLSEPSASKGTYSLLLGWRGDNPVLALSDEYALPLMVAVWDVDAGTLEPLATLPSYNISWGVGL